MPTVIDGVFEKGLFRPLKPVVLPERYPSKIVYDEPPAPAHPSPPTSASPAPAELPKKPPPAVYPEEYPDLGEDTYEYVAPPKVTRTVMVTFVDGGVRPAPQVPDEE